MTGQQESQVIPVMFMLVAAYIPQLPKRRSGDKLLRL